MAYLCPHPCEGKTEYGYCRYTWCINPLHSNLGTAYQGQGAQRVIITNADRIRAMTDEELADWLGVYCNGQTAQEVGKPCASSIGSCEECWLDWLEQEATDGK